MDLGNIGVRKLRSALRGQRSDMAGGNGGCIALVMRGEGLGEVALTVGVDLLRRQHLRRYFPIMLPVRSPRPRVCSLPGPLVRQALLEHLE